MNYRRVPRFRRYPHIKPDTSKVQDNMVNIENIEKELSKDEIENIPMPNENSSPDDPEAVRNNKPKFIDNFIRNIHADDIILLGLIFILIQEKLEDEFLIIVLIYLLVAGRDF
ncbi:hypothetical protein [Acetivibrio cellulolyticus]|uniref:hypothetical protein n=1 Tax=Acetivibrio cellulolyticus TaxID=35830 RepID=UPI0001E2E26C|nr:hypothetical protein [Acetivibrio cellulolyticus]